GQNQSAGGGTGGDKKDDKEKKKKYEPPIPTRVGKKKRKTKGPDAATKLPQERYVFEKKYKRLVMRLVYYTV
ncbi:26S proteasome regulatory subunit 4, partial [Homalodisca vitripennis]